MRWSTAVIKTRRDDPSEATDVSHKLMLRTGMIHAVSQGVYSWLPLGHRVLKQVERIIREEMDAAGGQEILMPALIPKELWDETGRWERYGANMMHVTDRKGVLHGLGPTHEEPVTDVARNFLRSHRDLEGSVLLYQIQYKFRDETRPRGGVLRGREFGMKDAYSFDINEERARASFERMHDAYTAVFRRMGLDFTAVRADSGAIGGDNSREFIARTPSGDVEFFECTSCDYKANIERAKGLGDLENIASCPPLTVIETPGLKTVEELVNGLPALGHSIPASRMIKTIIYQTSEPGTPVVAAEVMGDDEINEVKLAHAVGCAEVSPAGHDVVMAVTKAPVGFAGPINLPENVRLYIDERAIQAKDVLFGVNEVEKHAIHGDPTRDISHLYTVIDIRNARDGDGCSGCDKGTLRLQQGIEVGHIFQLGEVYSRPMNATYAAADGSQKPFVMGCYGIGTTRAVAVAVLQHHDDQGIAWPTELAPFHAVITPTNMSDASLTRAAEQLYTLLQVQGLDVLLDDRRLSAGEKFKDADLVGIPWRCTLGKTYKERGNVELRFRKSGAIREIGLADVGSALKEFYGR